MKAIPIVFAAISAVTALCIPAMAQHNGKGRYDGCIEWSLRKKPNTPEADLNYQIVAKNICRFEVYFSVPTLGIHLANFPSRDDFPKGYDVHRIWGVQFAPGGSSDALMKSVNFKVVPKDEFRKSCDSTNTLECFNSVYDRVSGSPTTADSAPATKLSEWVADIARHAKGARFKKFDGTAERYVLTRMRDVLPTSEGRLQISLETCRYLQESKNLALFTDLDENPVDWSPEHDERRCADPEAWEQARHLVVPEAVDRIDRIHSYDEDGSLQDGTVKSTQSFSVIIACAPGKACIDTAGGAPVERIEIPCRDEAACKAIARAGRAATGRNDR